MMFKIDRKNNVIRLFGITLLIAGGAIFLNSLINYTTHANTFFIISLLAIILCSFYGEFRSAIATMMITAIADYYFLYLPHMQLFNLSSRSSLIELAIFLAVSIVTIFVIDKLKNEQHVVEHQRKEREYQELLSQIQKQNEVYKKEIKARDEFLSIASHELKTPLTAMLLQLQTALYNIRTVSLANFSVENLLKMLQSTEQQSKRLAKMINDLLNVSLITTGRIDLQIEEFDLSQLVRSVVDSFIEKAKREGYQIASKTDDKIIGNWDKTRIEQVITNLLSNALKYGNKKPIAITVSKNDTNGKIVISDQGIGIIPEQQERVFELFERAVPNHEYKGLGVGLYISSQIVKAHKGNIHVKSKPQQGSTFTVELPLKNKD